MNYYFNYLLSETPDDFGHFGRFLQLADSRRAVHVGNLTFNDGKEVEKHLLEDVMKSVKPWMEVLMEEYRWVAVALSAPVGFALILHFGHSHKRLPGQKQMQPPFKMLVPRHKQVVLNVY